MTNPPKIKPVCTICGSDEVTRDAIVRWDVEAQTWIISSLLEDLQCDHCGETDFKEEPV